MANRYWVGGTDNWSNTSHWSNSSGGSGGASVPDSNDDVFIDENSGFGSGGTITLPNGIDANFHNLTCSSNHTYTINGSSNNRTINVYGSLILESGLTLTSSSMYFLSDNDENITSNGVYIKADTSKNGAGKLTLLDDTEFRTFYFNSGSFDLNNFNSTINEDNGDFSVEGTDLTLNLGSGTLYATSFNCYSEDLTLIKGTSTIKLRDGAEFVGGGYIYNNIWFLGESFIYDSNTFNNLKIDAGGSLRLNYGTTTTVSSFTALGTEENLIKINDLVSGGEILTLEINNGGGGYAVNNVGEISGALGYKALYQITAVSGGVVTGIQLWYGESGSGYSVGNNIPTVRWNGSGSGLTVNITSVSEILRGASLSKSSGIVECDYLDISNSNAIGGATWYAGSHSIDGGNNEGWIFEDAPYKYSRGDYGVLNTDDADLENLFTEQEYEDVAVKDGIYVPQTAINEHAVFLFKNKNDNITDSVEVIWNGQSDLAPSDSTVYLQVYNRTTEEWETIDSDNSSSADTNFELTATITTNLDDYYDVDGWVSCRVYQEMVSY